MSPETLKLNKADRAMAHPVTLGEFSLPNFASQGADDWDIRSPQFGVPVGFTFAHRRTCSAPLFIYGGGHGLQVCGSYAGTIMAEVIRLQPIGNQPDQHLIGETGGGSHSPAAIRAATDTKSAIALGLSTDPLPAGAEIGPVGGNRADPHLGPETGGESFVAKGGGGKLSLHRKVAPFVAVPSDAHRIVRAFHLKGL